MNDTLQEKYEEMMELYEELKSEIRFRDKHLFERWKAGGYIVDPDVMSMYPHIGTVVEQLEDGDEEDEDLVEEDDTPLIDKLTDEECFALGIKKTE